MDEEPMSAEEFTRRHPALMDAIGCTVRNEINAKPTSLIDSINTVLLGFVSLELGIVCVMLLILIKG